MARRRGRIDRIAGVRTSHASTEDADGGEAAILASVADALAQSVARLVYAPDEKSAEAAAIAEFKIGADMRRRLIVRPDDD
jgi:hypothetical protein